LNQERGGQGAGDAVFWERGGWGGEKKHRRERKRRDPVSRGAKKKETPFQSKDTKWKNYFFFERGAKVRKIFFLGGGKSFRAHKSDKERGENK